MKFVHQFHRLSQDEIRHLCRSAGIWFGKYIHVDDFRDSGVLVLLGYAHKEDLSQQQLVGLMRVKQILQIYGLHIVAKDGVAIAESHVLEYV